MNYRFRLYRRWRRRWVKNSLYVFAHSDDPNNEAFDTSASVVNPVPLVAIVAFLPFRRFISCRTFVFTVVSGAKIAGGGGTGGIGGGGGTLTFGNKKLMLLHFQMGCSCCPQTVAAELRLHCAFQDRSPCISGRLQNVTTNRGRVGRGTSAFFRYRRGGSAEALPGHRDSCRGQTIVVGLVTAQHGCHLQQATSATRGN